MKGLARFFKHETFRRGTSLIREDEPNEKVLIMKSGECQFMKNFFYEEHNHLNQKQMKLANGGSTTILGCEFLLMDFYGSSKIVNIAIKALQENKD